MHVFLCINIFYTCPYRFAYSPCVAVTPVLCAEDIMLSFKRGQITSLLFIFLTLFIWTLDRLILTKNKQKAKKKKKVQHSLHIYYNLTFLVVSPGSFSPLGGPNEVKQTKHSSESCPSSSSERGREGERGRDGSRHVIREDKLMQTLLGHFFFFFSFFFQFWTKKTKRGRNTSSIVLLFCFCQRIPALSFYRESVL